MSWSFALSPRLIGAVTALALALSVAPPTHGALSYNLYSPLKQTGCAGDGDDDCLDDSLEASLAWAASPWYFYDEDEDCSGWTNKFGLPSSHFERRDYIQVRPQGTGIRNWSSTDGKAKWVTITYLFLYPHDCGNLLGIKGHQGDSENIRFHLYSYDLRTWYLSHAYYWHHNHIDYVSGSFLQGGAVGLGTSWASIAADEDSHGSWPGKEVSSSHCAGAMDDIFECSFGSCDCFINTWRSDYQNGYMDVPSASRNVGGPRPERWNAAVVTVAGAEAYSALNVGHGTNREYWTPRGDSYRYFCGWECSPTYRKSDGHCAVSIHDKSGCAQGPLWDKVDSASFDLDPPSTSCSGFCGGYTGACWCDSACVSAGDCCFDACSVCGVCSGSLPPGPELTGGAWEGWAASAVGSAPVSVTPEQHARAERARALAAEKAQELRAAVDPDPGRRDDEARRRLRRAADPVAALVPMLLDFSPVEQLRTLRWASGVSDRLRLAALFDDLRSARDLGRLAREEEAHERVLDLIALLEVEGVTAPSPPDPPVAEVVPDAPPPDAIPDLGGR